MRVNQSLHRVVASLLCASAYGLPQAAHCADYPMRPITIVVGFSAGGSTDVMARIVAEKLAAGLGQPVLVENRAGVGAIVGTAFVAKASNPANSVPDLVEQSKLNPDKANYGASSASFQLITELFNSKTGARFAHIPYKGSNDSITAVMTGDVSMTLVDAGAASAGLAGGRVKALAVTSTKRHKAYPDVPTMSELGVDLQVSFWTGLLAPAGTPADIVKRLQQELARVMDMPDVKNRLTALSVTPASSSSEEFAVLIAAELSLWRQVAKDNHIKAD